MYASRQGKVFANLRILVRTRAVLELPRTRKPAVQSHFWKLRFPKSERISSNVPSIIVRYIVVWNGEKVKVFSGELTGVGLSE
jgi:hypothetical protein